MENDDTNKRPHYHSHALSRGLTLLKAVAASREPVTLADLHESTGNPKSTLVRLLAVLEDEDYLVRVDDRPAFRLGQGLLPVASSYLDSANVADVVRSTLQDLATELDWTVNFAVLDGDEIVHLSVAYPSRQLRYNASEGERAAAYCSGLGKALLAELDDEALESAVPPEPFPAPTRNTITSIAHLRRDIDDIRRRGYALDDEESASGLRCIAVPVKEGRDVLGSLSVSGPAAELEPANDPDVAKRLAEAAGELVAEGRLRSVLAIAAHGG